MTTFRQLLAAVWTAVWVRWRLLTIRTRRLFAGGGPAVVAGSGFYLSPAEIPVEGVDYELIDLPPELAAQLDAARVELVDQARGATTRRVRRRRARRRRTASLVTAALVTLAVLGAGATALVNGSTGVPAIDRLLGIYEAELDKPGAADRMGPTGRDLQPAAPSAASKAIAVPLSEGPRQLVSTAYVANDGKVCSAMTEVGGSGQGASGDVTCELPEIIGKELARSGGYVHAANVEGDEVIVRGFVDDHVGDLAGVGPNGAFDVRVGELWAPGLDDLGRLRPFVAVGNAGGARRLQTIDRTRYIFERATENSARLEFAP